MNRILNKSWFNFDFKEEKRESIIISIIAFLVPLLLAKLIALVFKETSLVTSNAEVIIWTIVNSLLIVGALNLRGWRRLAGVIILPGIATYFSALLFGLVPKEILWMVPAIWIGNFALIFIYKWLKVENNFSYLLTGLIGVTIKVLIIFGLFSLLNAFHVFPREVVDTLRYLMGVMQGLSGVFGLLLSYLIYTSYK